MKTLSFLLLLWVNDFCFVTSSSKAIPLIKVKGTSKEFVLNPEAISMMEQLSSPIKVIAAIGDARVGKSTALNFIQYALSSNGTSKNAEEVFETGDTMQAVTRGVWISTVQIPGNDKTANVILLDVEGTDLGNDEVTDKLSIFTALTSSTLMLFMKESPSTHILDFLYKIVRLSEVAFGKKESEHFPRLTVVLRGALGKPPKYGSIEDYMIDALISPTWNDGSDDKRKAICIRFPRENIDVYSLPYDPSTPKLFKTTASVSSSKYLNSIKGITGHISESSEKRSLNGVVLDGQNLADLAISIVKVMNDDTLWDELNSDFYKLFEDDLCRKSYEKLIQPLLDVIRNTAQDMEAQKDEKLNLFKENCNLESWILEAKLNIKHAFKNRKDYEKQDNILDTAIWLGKVAAGTLAGALGVRLFLSDVRLKNNITLMNTSEYETIGLRGVEWVWNQDAERLGLSGKGSGVVAQEVELLYPWAVTEGYDGYKRVDYPALRLMIWAKKFQQKAKDLMINI